MLQGFLRTLLLFSLLSQSLLVFFFVHQPCENHAPEASVTQVIHPVYTLSTSMRIRVDPSMSIFWVSVIVALSDIFLMFSTILFFTIPSAPTTIGITLVFIFHILCISNSRSLYLLLFSISCSAMFLTDEIIIVVIIFIFIIILKNRLP